MLGPQDGGGHGDPIGGRRGPLGQGHGHHPRPGPVPGDRGRHGPGRGVDLGQVVEAPVVGLEARPRPVRPEVPQVRPDGLGAAVEQLLDQAEVVERLVPELALGLGLQHPPAAAGQRRGDHQGPHPLGGGRGGGLGDPAADVVAGQHRVGQAELVDQPEHAPGLGGRRVGLGRRGRVLVGGAEAAQVGNDHLGVAGQQGRQGRMIGPVAGPAVQQHHRVAGAGAVVGQGEAVDRGRAGHRTLLRRWLGWSGGGVGAPPDQAVG